MLSSKHDLGPRLIVVGKDALLHDTRCTTQLFSINEGSKSAEGQALHDLRLVKKKALDLMIYIPGT